MSHVTETRARGSARVELAVAIGVIVTMLAIVCPALSHARVGGRTVVCENILHNFGIGMLVYSNDNLDFIPGVNTSGVATRAKVGTDALNARDVPVQSWDWLTPLLQDDPALPEGRAERFNYVYSEYRCPLQARPAISMWPACSYLMPAYFSFWGQAHRNEVVGHYEANPALTIRASVPSASWPVTNATFNSHIEQVGPAARKIFVADGTRYVNQGGLIDVDTSPDPAYFGAFADLGGWEPLCNAYGEKAGSRNWDGDSISTGSASGGLNLPLSYRHPAPPPSVAPSARPPVHYQAVHLPGLGDQDLHPIPVGAAQDNPGCINAVYFDGHVERLTDRWSRDIDRWYPTGSVVSGFPIGMTTVTQGYVIP
jgi:prepilin-type processing-associated H-X9-DG protein